LRGESYRTIAEVLLGFRGTKEDWEADPRKNQARRLVAHGLRMMRGGYRLLLHYPIKRPPSEKAGNDQRFRPRQPVPDLPDSLRAKAIARVRDGFASIAASALHRRPDRGAARFARLPSSPPLGLGVEKAQIGDVMPFVIGGDVVSPVGASSSTSGSSSTGTFMVIPRIRERFVCGAPPQTILSDSW
jgi:hypothetical protein